MHSRVRGSAPDGRTYSAQDPRLLLWVHIALTDSMLRLLAEQPFFGVRFRGTTYDTGTKLGFLKANIAYALERKDIDPDIVGELKSAFGA